MAERKRTSKAGYTPTEVGALIEELRSEFRTVVDIAREVKAEVGGLKAWREEMSVWREEMDVWRLGLNHKLDGITVELRTIRADLKAFDDRLRAVESKVGL